MAQQTTIKGRLSKIFFCLVAAVPRSTVFLFRRGRLNLTGRPQSAASLEPATGIAAAMAPKWKRCHLCRLQRVLSNWTVGVDCIPSVPLLPLSFPHSPSLWPRFGSGLAKSRRCPAGQCSARSRRKCPTERRSGGVCESGSDSGSSTGSVRASRGSWGSWSSASSIEGDRDGGARMHACTTSSRKSKECLFLFVHVFTLVLSGD